MRTLLVCILLLFITVRITKDPVGAPKRSVDYKYLSIYNLVRAADARHTSKYAHTVTSHIIRYSDQYKIPSALTAAVGYTESNFRMSSRPCVGIMQVYMPTYNLYDRKTGLDPRKIEDNIHLGVRELARYYHKRWDKMTSRGKTYQQSRLRYTLGRYNGCGPNGRYVTKVLCLYKKLIIQQTKR